MAKRFVVDYDVVEYKDHTHPQSETYHISVGNWHHDTHVGRGMSVWWNSWPQRDKSVLIPEELIQHYLAMAPMMPGVMMDNWRRAVDEFLI